MQNGIHKKHRHTPKHDLMESAFSPSFRASLSPSSSEGGLGRSFHQSNLQPSIKQALSGLSATDKGSVLANLLVSLSAEQVAFFIKRQTEGVTVSYAACPVCGLDGYKLQKPHITYELP